MTGNFFFGKLLRVWLLLGLFFGLAETGMRYRALERFGKGSGQKMVIDDPVEGRYLAPNVSVKGTLNSVSINEHGYRGKSFPLEPAAGVLRIAVLGSSTVYGGKTDNTTFPAFLEKDLNQRFGGQPPIEVINTGCAGYGTESVITHLEKRVYKIKPKLALFYPPPNDLGTEILGPGAARNAELTKLHFLARWRKSKSVLYNAVLDKIKNKGWSPKSAAAEFKHFPPDGKEHLKAKYKLLIDACRKLNIVPVFVVHSFMLRKDQTPAEQRCNLHGDFWGLGVAGALEATEAQTVATREIAASEHVPLIDAAMGVPADDEHFQQDGLHFNDKGNAVFAEVLADELIKHKLVP